MNDQVITSALFDLQKENAEFRCDICRRYLSIAPILYHETVGKVCGRCDEQGETRRFAGITFQRQEVYEEIAKLINFPCSYQSKGCEEVLKWGAVGQHEASCTLREDKCIFGYESICFDSDVCQWRGNRKQLPLHLKEMHSDYFQQFPTIGTTVEDILSSARDTIIWFQYMDMLFVSALYWDGDEGSLFANVVLDAPSMKIKDFTFDLEVSDTQNTKKMIFSAIELYSLRNRAMNPTFFKRGFSVHSSVLQTFFDTQILDFSFKIKKNGSNLLEEKSEPIAAKNFIFKYACMKCEHILNVPIYTCKNHHNLCLSCKQSGKCKCQAEIFDSRNEALENISKIALHNCKNEEDGCTELLDVESLPWHEEHCKLTIKRCVIGCGWKGNNLEMLNHVIQEHHPIILKEKYAFTSSLGRSRNFCTIFEGKIFVLKIVYKIEEQLSINVKYLSAERENFQFQFSICSHHLKLECRNFCQPILFGEWSENPITFIYPYDLLKQFLINKNHFFFKIDIFRTENDI